MHPYFDDYWPWYVASWALTILSTGLLLWALFRDRARRGGELRLRCPKCWYDMRGVAQDISDRDAFPDDLSCPECGRGIKGRRDLTRTRRRWPGLIVALVALGAGYWCFKNPTAIWGWRSYLPSTALILMPLWSEDRVDEFFFGYQFEVDVWHDLSGRIEDGLLWGWQERVLLARMRQSLRRQGRYGMTPTEREFAGRIEEAVVAIPEAPITIDDLMDLIRQQCNVNLVIDPQLQADSYLFRDEPLQLPKENVRLIDLLDRFYWSLNLEFPSFRWRINGESITLYEDTVSDLDTRYRFLRVDPDLSPPITTVPPLPSAFVSSPLKPGTEAALRLADLIVHNINPNHWADLGGDEGFIFEFSHHLVVRTSVRELQAIEVLSAQVQGEIDWPLPEDALQRLIDLVPKATITRVHDIGDIAPYAHGDRHIMDLIKNTIDPRHWSRNDNARGYLYKHGTKLVAKTTVTNHLAVETLLNILREKISRGIDPFDSDATTVEPGPPNAEEASSKPAR